MFVGDGNKGLEDVLPLPHVQPEGGTKHIMRHPSNGRAGSMHYKAAYFSPSLTSHSRALLGAKCFSQAPGDVLPESFGIS